MMGYKDRAANSSFWAAEDSEAVVRRVWHAAPVVGLVMVATALAAFHPSDALGVAVGAGLALINFWFLHTSLQSILGAGYETPPRGTSVMLLLRWFVVAIAAYAIYRTGWASGSGILVGLLAPAGAVLLEAGYQLACALAHRDVPGANDTNRGRGLQ
jgi:hypothetical protein